VKNLTISPPAGTFFPSSRNAGLKPEKAQNEPMVHSPLHQKIGQLFLIGFAGETLWPDHPLVADIADENLGGVILFDRFLAKKSDTHNIIDAKQLQRLTADLQSLAGGQLLIAVDQEGGRVNRFSPARGFPVTPPASELGRTGNLELTAASARQTARMLEGVGVNFNLAPVVDVNIDQDNPIIGRCGRSFSDRGETVAAHAAVWIREHRAAGLHCCLKHFPGHGSSRADSHRGFVDITSTWQKGELEPYRLLIKEGLAEAVMVGHLINKKFDANNPATLSPTTIQSLLRHDLGFKGLVVSDDMQMKAITDHYRLEEACCCALAAGIDLLIIGNNLVDDPGVLGRMKAAIVQAVDKGILAEQRIDEAWTAVQTFTRSSPRV
jgi:beta-N-acetylhexosaminidase